MSKKAKAPSVNNDVIQETEPEAAPAAAPAADLVARAINTLTTLDAHRRYGTEAAAVGEVVATLQELQRQIEGL